VTAEVQDSIETPDLDVILPQGGLTTVGGFKVRVRRLKTREFLALMRVITNGLGPGLGGMKLDTDDQEQMKADLVALVVTALPNAAEEFVEFLNVVIEPESTGERAGVALAMQNPDPMEALDLIGVVVEQEIPDLAVLAGKARAWISRIQQGLRTQAG
jgi:hypothetical protein